MDLYSPLLLAAIVATVLALGMAIAALLGFRRARLVTLVPVVAGIGIVCLVAAAAYHVYTGHPIGTPRALSPLDFLTEHRAIVVTAACAFVALGLGTKARGG
jgi:hypothetical protein